MKLTKRITELSSEVTSLTEVSLLTALTKPCPVKKNSLLGPSQTFSLLQAGAIASYCATVQNLLRHLK